MYWEFCGAIWTVEAREGIEASGDGELVLGPMLVDGKHYRTIWLDEDGVTVKIIDQRVLPHRFVIEDVSCVG